MAAGRYLAGMSAYTTGVVCSSGPAGARPAPHTDNYLIGVAGDVTWRDGERERRETTGGAGALFAICAGLGEGPDVASTSTARVMGKLYRPGVPPDPAKALREYVLRSHERLHDRTATAGPVRMGAALTLAWCLEGRATWIQVGHARMFLWRRGALTRLTPLHTRKEFAVRDGVTLPDEPDSLAQAFLFGSRGLGDDRSLRLEPGLDVGSEYLEPGDRLVFLTASVAKAVDEVSVADVLRNVADPQASSVSVVERARARGSQDPLTVLITRVDRIPARTMPPEGGARKGVSHTFG
jgi:serine/threonine protein phosphatase PrpC